jgi:radical SAM superfamily enzyme YgiQ (UPF0313 family)
MIVRGYVIVGYPDETPESLVETEGVLKSLPVDDLRISFLTPFPGSSLYDDYRDKGLILTDDFSKFTSEEPILKIPGLPPAALRDARMRICRNFYRSDQYQRRIEEKLRQFPYLKQSYDEFVVFLVEREILR